MRGVCSLVPNFEALVKKRSEEPHVVAVCEGAGMRAH